MWNDPTQAEPMRCLVCIVEHKTAAQAGQPKAPPPMRPAVTLMQTQFGPVTPICLEHIQVGTQSRLAVPNGVLPGRG